MFYTLDIAQPKPRPIFTEPYCLTNWAATAAGGCPVEGGRPSLVTAAEVVWVVNLPDKGCWSLSVWCNFSVSQRGTKEAVPGKPFWLAATPQLQQRNHFPLNVHYFAKAEPISDEYIQICSIYFPFWSAFYVCALKPGLGSGNDYYNHH